MIWALLNEDRIIYYLQSEVSQESTYEFNLYLQKLLDLHLINGLNSYSNSKIDSSFKNKNTWKQESIYIDLK